MQAHRMPARQGLVWLIAGFRLFGANPSLLALLTFCYLIAVSLALALPLNIGRIIFLLVQPLLLLMVANGCRAIALHGRRIARLNIVAGVTERRGELLRLGALQMVAMLICTTLVVLGFGLFMDIQVDPEHPETAMPLVIASVVVSLPIVAATWFAPILVGWHSLAPLKAAFFSLVAMLRNWPAFLLYGALIGGAFALAFLGIRQSQQLDNDIGSVLAMAIEFLLLAVSPVVMSGPFISYRDIFTSPAPEHE